MVKAVSELFGQTHLPDNSVSTVYCFAPGEDAAVVSAASGEAPLVMMWPGFGMGARYYRPLAHYLAERGFPVAIGELHGQGTSTAKATPSNKWGYHKLASQDYPEAIREAKRVLGLPVDHPTYLLTHSMGGQIGSLFLSRPEAKELNVQGMMGVGSGSPYHRGFIGKAHVRALLGGQMMGQIAKHKGYWPGGALDFAGYGRQSGTHLYEWSLLNRMNTFANLAGQDQDYTEALKQVDVPVLLTRFANDPECTMASCEFLLGHMPKAPRKAEELAGWLGHNKWAREPEIVGDRFIEFVDKRMP
ncbi:alpha/beta fold hydrolase [Corynebacterium aquatimens]